MSKIMPLKTNIDLLKYMFLVYFDKLLVFLSPLLIYWFTKSENVYNNIEYIISISVIVVVFFDLGLNNYFFYGYRNASEGELYVEDITKKFILINIIYLLVFVMIIPIIINFNLVVFVFVYFRVVSVSIFNFIANVFRVKDKPICIFYFTISSNVISILLLIMYFKYGVGSITVNYFTPQFVIGIISLAIVTSLYIKNTSFITRDAKSLVVFFKKIINYSWPIVVAALATLAVANISKVFAYTRLSANEMFNLSYTIRFATLIQLAHTSILTFFIKKLYISKKKDEHKKVFNLYIIVLFFATLMAVILYLFFNFLFNTDLKFDVFTILVFVYFFIWCVNSYFEVYFSIFNYNKIKLLITSISFAIYIVPLFVIKTINIELLVYLMLFSVLFNTLLNLYVLSKVKFDF